ncbi:glutathione peroxidase [Pseudomonas matsuisoli]|uniref:Glutathione peroxidase n=1 Tax=Pseudomonas matsuisoli TaxID=1515666 RepID=A0A917UZF6_9PSED|nr:glutathione peroxidase [Pseudomonas matsuisoli]GGK00786.1 glutathione peroxidase [Pseudomonas matsuisoli]
MTTLHEIPVTTIDGAATSLSHYQGKVLLIVNVASKCGLTKQYEALQSLYEQRKDAGLEVLGFPANDFKEQEPGSDEEIKTFCSTTYEVTFPLFSKVSVVGEDKHPLFAALTAAKPNATGEGPMREKLKGYGIEANPVPEVQWNFEKFLVSREGEVIERFAPDVTPDDARLVNAIEAALARSA